jgi:hypothetical protein
MKNVLSAILTGDSVVLQKGRGNYSEELWLQSADRLDARRLRCPSHPSQYLVLPPGSSL